MDGRRRGKGKGTTNSSAANVQPIRAKPPAGPPPQSAIDAYAESLASGNDSNHDEDMDTAAADASAAVAATTATRRTYTQMTAEYDHSVDDEQNEQLMMDHEEGATYDVTLRSLAHTGEAMSNYDAETSQEPGPSRSWQ